MYLAMKMESKVYLTLFYRIELLLNLLPINPIRYDGMPTSVPVPASSPPPAVQAKVEMLARQQPYSECDAVEAVLNKFREDKDIGDPSAALEKREPVPGPYLTTI